MLTEPNSFSMTARRLPWAERRMWLRRVVFPEPRKPQRTSEGGREEGLCETD